MLKSIICVANGLIIQAFKKAWNEACSSTKAVFVVPKDKTYLVKQIKFKGPCKDALTVQVHHVKYKYITRTPKIY